MPPYGVASPMVNPGMMATAANALGYYAKITILNNTDKHIPYRYTSDPNALQAIKVAMNANAGMDRVGGGYDAEKQRKIQTGGENAVLSKHISTITPTTEMTFVVFAVNTISWTKTLKAGCKYEITQAKIDALESLGPGVQLFPPTGGIHRQIMGGDQHHGGPRPPHVPHGAQVSYFLSNLVFFWTPLNLPEDYLCFSRTMPSPLPSFVNICMYNL
jgi:hypothetical protein